MLDVCKGSEFYSLVNNNLLKKPHLRYLTGFEFAFVGINDFGKKIHFRTVVQK